MPRPLYKSVAERAAAKAREAEQQAFDMANAEYEAFERFAAEFRQSKRGNLWRKYEGATLTVFHRDEQGFRWCIADEDGETRFSQRGYGEEDEALGALWNALAE
jgi:hypothetical protein